MWIEREKVVTELERRSDEGTRAARKRWDAARSKLDATPNALPNGSPMPLPMQDQTRAEQTRAEQTRAEQTRADIKLLPQTTFADDRTAIPDTKKSKPSDAQIEELYSLYPRKRDKLDAKKAIGKAVSLVMTGDRDHGAMSLQEALDYLVQRLTLYARCAQGCDRDFIPYPATWFNAGGFWDDERDWSSERKGKSNGSGTELPHDYDPASAQIRRERELAGVAR